MLVRERIFTTHLGEHVYFSHGWNHGSIKIFGKLDSRNQIPIGNVRDKIYDWFNSFETMEKYASYKKLLENDIFFTLHYNVFYAYSLLMRLSDIILKI